MTTKIWGKGSQVTKRGSDTKHGLISFVYTAITSNYGINRINI